MKKFTLRQLSFGPLVIDDDGGLPALAEARHRLDADGDMPRLAAAVDLRGGCTAIDVGAFVGDTTVALAVTGAHVIAFEPFLDAFVCMLYNTQGLRVRAINRPAGNGERVELVTERYGGAGHNHGMRSVIPSDAADSVLTVRIDELELPACSLIKIDCEGSEIPTLIGAKETIARCRPFLYVEMFKEGLAWRGYTPEQLEAQIRSMGYNLEMWGEPPRWDWFCRPV